MTNLATKNGSLIVKDGKLAESCGCCGDQWYCYGCPELCLPCGNAFGVAFTINTSTCKSSGDDVNVTLNGSVDISTSGGYSVSPFNPNVICKSWGSVYPSPSEMFGRSLPSQIAIRAVLVALNGKYIFDVTVGAVIGVSRNPPGTANQCAFGLFSEYISFSSWHKRQDVTSQIQGNTSLCFLNAFSVSGESDDNATLFASAGIVASNCSLLFTPK